MSTTTVPAIQLRGITKRFGRFTALDDLTLTVPSGQVTGFLGPNGAGKSTAIRVILGLLRANAGTARLLGGDAWKDAVALHRQLAYVPGDVTLWPGLSGGETIDVLGRMRGGLDRRRRDALVERFELDPRKKVRTYSKGNRQKVALVAALASDAQLLILDEPTSGLDPLMEAIFTDCVREALDRGASVLLSSHILSEVEKLCDTVAIIRKGHVVEAGTLDDLRTLTRTHVVAETAEDADALAAAPGVHGFARRGARVSFDVEQSHLDEVIRSLSALGLKSLVSNPPSLEELFLREYGDDLPAADRTDRTDRAGGATPADRSASGRAATR